MLGKKTPLLAFALLVSGFALACAPNPADDKPEAVVQEPSDTVPEASEAAATSYTISPESSKITWIGSKVTGVHPGGFSEFSGTVTASGTPESLGIDVTIETDSLFTEPEKLVGHLKSADFFDVETYPTATFHSTGVAAGETEGTYSVTGDLTLHGVTKQITFPATIAVTDDEVSAQAEFSINRFDFDIKYPGKPDDLIREEVVIGLDINAMAQSGDAMGSDMGDSMADHSMADDGMAGEGDDAMAGDTDDAGEHGDH